MLKERNTLSIFPFGTEGRTRTGTGINSHRILSPVRLPVPPPRQTVYYNLADKYRDSEIFMQIFLCYFPKIEELLPISEPQLAALLK